MPRSVSGALAYAAFVLPCRKGAQSFQKPWNPDRWQEMTRTLLRVARQLAVLPIQFPESAAWLLRRQCRCIIILDDPRIVALRLQLQDILADLDAAFLGCLEQPLIDIDVVHIAPFVFHPVFQKEDGCGDIRRPAAPLVQTRRECP